MIFDVLRSSVQAKDIFNENIPENLKKDCGNFEENRGEKV